MNKIMNGIVDFIYRVAIYIRLSKEDEKEILEAGKSSESVENQKSLLLKFVQDNHYYLVDIYIDDGYTGTNFERPAFKRMIRDIEAGKINMVVTKDLSRLGRDYIGTGEYVEKYFPMHNVRYVSILDGIDTSLDNSNNEIAPFKSIINDMYSRDNSKKIRAALLTKQRDGKWVGGCTPFGYMKDPNDKNHLVVNEEEAVIVKKIFKLALEGNSPYKIREILNEEKIPTSAMLRDRNSKTNTMARQGIWSVKTIQGMLTNRVYTGDLVQNRNSRISYKVRKVVPNKKEDWIIVESTHEALIDKDSFKKVQSIAKTKTVRATKKIIRCLDGLLYCYECKSRITISSPRKEDNRTYIACNYYRMYSKLKLCTSHGFNYDKLEEEILNQIRKILKLSLDKEALKNKLSKKINDNSPILNINNDIKKLEVNLEVKKNNLDKMYIDKLEGKITDDMYNRINLKLNEEIKNILKKLETLKSALCEFREDDETSECDKVINDFLEMEIPSRSVMLKLINKIEIHNDKTVDIYFNFKRLNFLINDMYHN